jgi:hypothetical protein
MTKATNRKDFDCPGLPDPHGCRNRSGHDCAGEASRPSLLGSDACAVEAVPDLRHPPSAPPVRFDDIMDALKRLDGDVADKPQYGKFINRARRWKDLYQSDPGHRSPFA